MDHILNAQQQQQQGISGLQDPLISQNSSSPSTAQNNIQPHSSASPATATSTPGQGAAAGGNGNGNGNGNGTGSTPGSPLAVGIHCANPTCKTRTGERSRGHQSCRWQLCGHCCQTLARESAEKGERREICKVHSRRVHTGHRVVPRDGFGPGFNVGGTQGVFGLAMNIPPEVALAEAGAVMGGNVEEQLEKRSRLEQSWRRSVVVVVWYKVCLSLFFFFFHRLTI